MVHGPVTLVACKRVPCDQLSVKLPGVDVDLLMFNVTFGGVGGVIPKPTSPSVIIWLLESAVKKMAAEEMLPLKVRVPLSPNMPSFPMCKLTPNSEAVSGRT